MPSSLPYPPPFMDIATLAEHICCSESSIDRWIGEGLFPPPSKVFGSKRLWAWAEIERHLNANCVTLDGVNNVSERIRNATKAAIKDTVERRAKRAAGTPQ